MSDTIRSLAAGRELDALVATAIGWTDVRLGDDGLPPNSEMRDYIPMYSLCIESAWKVVDHLSARRFVLTLEDCRNIDISLDNRCWWATYEAPSGHDTGVYKGATAMEAICRAALAAVQIKE